MPPPISFAPSPPTRILRQVSDSEPPISMGGSSDEDILEESSDESDEELAVGGNVGVSTGFSSREK